MNDAAAKPLSRRAAREIRAVDAAVNATAIANRPTWREHLEWLEFSIDSALRHQVGT